uniref:WGS project CAEQ00000000 data, annotated contig 1735 n=1 Tax=Trypanosoma congolense (strain IL3000) TaxID=1068625 RepID=F9W8I5_TRYCI|nr:unnamed protein product [Trypanosoma congolense IL3000]
MSTKEEVAALMANSDPEAKISLLKKAVVTVTKQKQMLEHHNQQLQEQMATIGGELAQMQEENQNLQRRLKAVELDAERKIKQAAASGKSWMGLASLVPGMEAGDHKSGTKKGAAKSATGFNLSPEDQEKIIMENENVHKQLFELKSTYETEKREWDAKRSQQGAELQALQAEVMELRGHLDATRQAHERLNVQHITQKALVQFCHYFFTLSRQHPTLCSTRQKVCTFSIVPELTEESKRTPPREISEELSGGTVTAVATYFRTLLDAISVFIIALRDSFGTHITTTTSGNIHCYKDRLTTLLEAHNVRKADVLAHLQSLESTVANATSSAAALTQLMDSQGLLLSSVEQWLTLLLEHSRLVINACFITQCNTDNDDLQKNNATKVEMMSQSLMEALATVRGILNAAAFIFKDSEVVMRRNECSSVEWILALERFWWEGCNASQYLESAMVQVSKVLREWTQGIRSGTTKTSLKFIAELAESTIAHFHMYKTDEQGNSEENISYQTTPSLLPSIETILPELDADTFPSINNVEDDEIIHTLSSTDLSAICYHTQMNFTLMDLAAKSSALENAQKKVNRLEAINQQQMDESERMRKALQDQIRLLSEKLIQYTNSEDQVKGRVMMQATSHLQMDQ